MNEISVIELNFRKINVMHNWLLSAKVPLCFVKTCLFIWYDIYI